jgi:hypothetical protein
VGVLEEPKSGRPEAERELPLPAPFSLPLTLGIHARGHGDPSLRFEVSGSTWRGTDERTLELLEPYRGQRGRVIRLLELAGFKAPRFGPRLSPRRIDRL